MFEVNPVKISHIQRCYDHWKHNDFGYIYRKVFIIDDFYKNPDEVRELALSLGTSSEPGITGGLPGVRSFVPTDEVRKNLYPLYESLCIDNNIWQREWMISMPSFSEEWRKQGFMCNNINDESLLASPYGIIPHQDKYIEDPTSPPCQFGSVVYLNTPEECAGGTNLYSWDGMMSIPWNWGLSEKYGDGTYKEVRKAFDNSEHWKVEHEFEMVYNRMILYEAEILHAPNVDLGMFTDYSRVNQILFM